MTSNVGNCNRGDLLLISLLILQISLGRFMVMALMALLRSVPCPIILMSWTIFSLPTLKQWVPFFPFVLSLFVKFLFLFQSLTFPSLNCNPLSKSMRSWCGWSRISSWRWPTTQGSYTILKEWPTQVKVVIMMMTTSMMAMRRRRRRWLLATNQGRGDTVAFLQSQHTAFFSFSVFLFLLATFVFSLRQRIVLRTSFYIYAFDWEIST